MRWAARFSMVELLVVDVAAGPEAGHLAVPIVLGLEEVANDAPILHAEPELIAERRDRLVQPGVDLVVLRVRVRRLLDAPLHLGGALLRAPGPRAPRAPA